MREDQIDEENTVISGLFTVETAHGTQLQIDPETGSVFHAAPPAHARPGLVLYIPASAPTVGFLLSAQDDPPKFRVNPEPPDTILPFRLQWDRESGMMAMCHPFTGLYLCAGPVIADEPQSVIASNRDECGGWELFQPCPVERYLVSAACSSSIAALDELAEAPLTGPRLLETLEAGLGPSGGPAFAAFTRLLPLDQIEWLGPTILGRPPALTSLATAFPDDVFATTALPDLHHWLRTRPKAVHLHLPPELDELAITGLDGRYTSVAHICSNHARRCIPAREKVCVLATARNEGLYLVEWIAYHRSIGVEGFFIYSNDNKDGSDALLGALSNAGIITWISSELSVGSAAQPKAYGHALGVLPNILDYRWTLIIDLDEFFVFDRARFSSIQDFIDWQEARPVDAVALNWLVYGSSGEDAWQPVPLTSRFTNRLPWLDPHVKTLVRTNKIMQSRPHHPAIDARQTLLTRNASGDVHAIGDSPSFSAMPQATAAWINHYFLKSAEEFVWKFSRNRGDHALVRDANPAIIDANFVEMFVNQHRSGLVSPDDRILRCAGGQAEQTEYLLALPGVAEAMNGIRGLYRSEIDRLKLIMRDSPAFNAADTPHARLAGFLNI